MEAWQRLRDLVGAGSDPYGGVTVRVVVDPPVRHPYRRVCGEERTLY